MKKMTVIAMILIGLSALTAATPDEMVAEAQRYQQSNDLAKAVEILEQGLGEYPESADMLAHLGFYKGMQAGQTENYIEAGELASQSFEYLDKAVELDAYNLNARLYRGIIGVNVPSFFGKLDQAVGDLNVIVGMKEKYPERIPDALFAASSNYLAQAYEKQGNPEEAKKVLKKLIQTAPDTPEAQQAKKDMENKPAKSEPAKKKTVQTSTTGGAIYQKAQTLYAKGENGTAVQILKDYLKTNPKDVNAIYLLLQGLSNLANAGYDTSISEDTNTRANLAMDVVTWMDRAVKLDSSNIEFRIQRDAVGIQMPFFVGRLESSIADLEKIANSGISGKTRADALYWLGQGHRKKAMKYWNEVISKYPGQEVVSSIRAAMCPPIQKMDISSLEKPAVVVDFVLSYQDQLEPQTAVWVENKRGEYVATVYVSGFSGHVKDKQVVLPLWATASDFKGVDGVTAASIDLGEHIYVWKLKDYQGNPVKKGEYKIHVEVSHWPSMEYQTEVMSVKVGERNNKSRGKAGNCLSICEVQYLK